MKLFSAVLLLFVALSAFAQKKEEIIATANNQNYTVRDLAPEIGQEFENLPNTLAGFRQTLLDQMINDQLLEAEASARKVTVEKLLEREVTAKVAVPNEAQIKAIYDANRAAIGDKTLREVRSQIVAFLTREPEQKAFNAFLSHLKVKYKAALGKNVNAPNLARQDVLATIGGKSITVENFEAKNKLTIAEYEIDVYDQARASLEQTVFSNLLVAEAKSQNIEASDLIAREITDKMKEFSDAERANLETALREKLFRKYNANFLLKEIEPAALAVSVDDDPAQGKTTAPVTIVMFTDFQCPACSATHPALQKVIAEYSDKIRFVVRDFPLVRIHENAFQAAVAANAANAQGKFFEYAEILYNNQNALDTVSLKKYAADLRLNPKQFELDLASPKSADEVRKDLEDGKRYGISGTPTIFVNGVKIRALSEQNFRKAINRALGK